MKQLFASSRMAGCTPRDACVVSSRTRVFGGQHSRGGTSPVSRRRAHAGDVYDLVGTGSQGRCVCGTQFAHSSEHFDLDLLSGVVRVHCGVLERSCRMKRSCRMIGDEYAERLASAGPARCPGANLCHPPGQVPALEDVQTHHHISGAQGRGAGCSWMRSSHSLTRAVKRAGCSIWRLWPATSRTAYEARG
jgi:hypothetical protein